MTLVHKGFTRMKKMVQRIPKFSVIILVLLGVMLALAACGDQATQDTRRPIKATWIQPEISGDIASIPVSEVDMNKIVHFKVTVAMGKDIALMAYNIDGILNVRSNVCPPCRSIGFSLANDVLVCDTCQTTFKAESGEGISGACVAYPKAAVAYEIQNGKVLMDVDDITLAYETTLKPG